MTIEEKLKESLNDQQYQAATHMDGPAVVIAGAGSGKTKTLMSRVTYLVENWISPSRILMLTFTNSAADEMKNRATKLLDDRCKDIMAFTYHKFCNLMLRKYGKAIHIQNYNILTPSDTKNLIDYVKGSDDTYTNLEGFPSSKNIVSIFSKSVNCQQSIEETLKSDEKWYRYIDYAYELTKLKEQVDTYCFENQQFNYDDLLVYMNKLLDNEEIAQKVANLFDYIMVDEFQDTNNLQMDILQKIYKFNKNIMVVGDMSQSIYAFRGANVRNMQKFSKITSTDDIVCNLYELQTNYRSTQEILDFANNVMQKYVYSWTYTDMYADDKHGYLPVFLRPYDDFDQTNKTLQLINYYHKKGIDYSDIAIIERNSMSSFGIEAELTKLGIAFEKRGGMGFMDYECVGDILAYLIIIVKPHDILNWFRILKIHPFIGVATAKKIADMCKEPDFLLNKKWSKNKYGSELELLSEHYNSFRKEPDLQKLFDSITKFYFDVRTRAVLNSRMRQDYKDDAMDNIERDKLVIEQLKNMSTKYTKINEFLDDIVLDSVSETENEEDKLIITTIHSAKGLEWKAVILIDCIDGVFPRNSINYVRCRKYIEGDLYDPNEYSEEVMNEYTQQIMDFEEELRCFYVAITRAKDNLCILSPKMKMKNGFLEKVNPSQFIIGSQDFLSEKR